MTAFLPCHLPPFRTSTPQFSQICPRRTPLRSPPRVRFSATTDEAPPLDGPPTPIPPSRRPQSNSSPQQLASYTSSPAERQDALERPRPISGTPEERGRRHGESADAERAGRKEFDQRGQRTGEHPPFVVNPDATYYTSCANCKAAYVITPDMLESRGRKVGCSVCGNEWFQKVDRLMVLRDTEGMKPYPVEDKDRLIEEQAKDRAEKRTRRGDGDRRERREPREAREGGRRDRSSRAGQGQHTLFMANLPFSVTQEDLAKFIGEVVSFDRISLVTDANSKSKGFAFADLQSEEDVHKAVSELNGREVGGRTISVRVGRKK